MLMTRDNYRSMKIDSGVRRDLSRVGITPTPLEAVDAGLPPPLGQQAIRTRFPEFPASEARRQACNPACA
jgi:hypothetical protein